MIKVICQECGKEFETIPSRIKNGRGKFCSIVCSRKSEIPRKKISIANKGRKRSPRSDEYKEKQRQSHLGQKAWNKGIPHTNITKLKISKAHIGKKLLYKTKKKMSESRIGNKNPSWKGGISFEPYGLEFDEDLKEVIRNRDRRKCQFCAKTELEEKKKLCVHHIDYDKHHNDPKNLISLCRKCHAKTNYNRDYWKQNINIL